MWRLVAVLKLEGAIRLAWRKGPAGEGATLLAAQLEEPCLTFLMEVL